MKQVSGQTSDELRGLVARYVDDVLTGRRVVGKLERKAVERHAADLERLRAGWEGYRFDERAALRPLRFATSGWVVHTKGSDFAGRPFRFEERSAWMAFVIWSLFGWQKYHEERKRWVRRFSSAYVSVARKNGKTMLAAILALYLVAFDGEHGSEVYFAATKKDQARLGWKQAAQIVNRSRAKSFRKLFRVIDSTSRILLSDDSMCCALGKDADTMDGLNPHAAIVDELHAHPHRDTWDVLESGMGARSQPLMFGITTAGARRDGLCWELEHDVLRILDSVIEDEGTFGFIARLDEEDDVFEESVWTKANPNLGVSVTVDKLRQDATRAKNNVAYLNEFKRKRCNVWTEAVSAWIGLDVWDACRDEIDWEALRGEPCWVGVDLSKSNDITAVVAVFRRPDNRYIVRPWFWIPADTIEERVYIDRAPFDRWVSDGLVTACPGGVIDQGAVKFHVLNLMERYEIRKVGIDPRGAWWLTAELIKAAPDDDPRWIEKVRQGFWLSGPLKDAEDAIKAGALVHDGNPVLRWMFSNVAIREHADGWRRPDKQRSSGRIDGIVAMIMGFGLAADVAEDAPVPSVTVFGA